MLDPSKKEKRKGIIGTIFFHSFLLFIFLFMGLNYQDPPPAEEGISINFGFNDSGLGEIEPENTEEIAEIEEDKVIEKQIEENEEIITQSIEENPAIKVLEKKKEPIQNQEAKEEIVE